MKALYLIILGSVAQVLAAPSHQLHSRALKPFKFRTGKMVVAGYVNKVQLAISRSVARACRAGPVTGPQCVNDTALAIHRFAAQQLARGAADLPHVITISSAHSGTYAAGVGPHASKRSCPFTGNWNPVTTFDGNYGVTATYELGCNYAVWTESELDDSVALVGQFMDLAQSEGATDFQFTWYHGDSGVALIRANLAITESPNLCAGIVTGSGCILAHP